jgi:elongation factor P
MVQVSTAEMRPGMKVELDGQPYIIVNNEFVKPGKGQAFNRLKIKHLMTGRVIERVLKSGEKLDMADVVESAMRMVYREPDGAVFMDDTTYEQIKISQECIGDASIWLKEDLVYSVVFYNNQPVSVQPPTFLELTIIETAPGARGDTVSGRVLKPAILETGAKVQIPIFIEQGEKIKIDTRTGEYVSRV